MVTADREDVAVLAIGFAGQHQVGRLVYNEVKPGVSMRNDDAARLDSDPVIEAYKKDVDRTLLRENLKLSVDERFRKLEEMRRLAGELQRAGRQARTG